MSKSIGSNASYYNSIWGFTKEGVRSIYHASSFHQTTVDHLLCLWYFRIPVSDHYRLSGQTMLDAQLAAYVFTRLDGANYQVLVPFVFAVVWRPEIFEKEPFQHTYDQMDRYRLPKFALQVHHTTYKMLGLHAQLKKSLGPQSPIVPEYRETGNGRMEVKSTINELYAFAAEGPPSFLNAEVWVNPDISILDRLQTNTTVPLPDPNRTKLYETPDLYNGPDGYTPHAAEQYKSSDSYTYTGANDAELSAKEIADEFVKGLASSSSAPLQ